MKVLSGHSLAPFHTFGIDRRASHIITVESISDIQSIWAIETYQNLPKLMVGKGSNLLFCDDFQGVVILNRIKGIEVTETDEAYHLHVGSGEDWHELVTWTLQNDMPGMENLALIPGCVGSAPIQNIGAYGVELKDLCEYVDILDLRSGEVKRLSADECQFGYRDSIFKHEYKDNITITAVGLYLPKTWHPKLSYGPLADLANDNITATNIYDRVCQLRQSKLPDPKVCGNAGSFFKNPVISNTLLNKLKEEYPTMPSYAAGVEASKLAAGWLIDQCGLKGKSIGGAQVNPLQALVLTNTGTATSDDVINLAQLVVDTVQDRFGVVLQHEVRFMGSTGEVSLAEINLHE